MEDSMRSDYQDDAGALDELGDESTDADTAREYLRSINKSALLTEPEELDLGLDVARWMALRETRANMTLDMGSDPDTPEMAAALMMTTLGALNLLRAVGAESDMGLPPDAPASEFLSDRNVRNLLDAPLPEPMKERLADAIDVPIEEIGKRVAALAKASAVIPNTTFRLAENELGPRLYHDGLDADELAKTIAPERRRIERRWEIITARGQGASERLTISNLRLVVSVARRHLGRGLQFSDLVQEGNWGLARAVEKYDPRRGCKFSACATWWIRQAIARALAGQGKPIRLPVQVVERILQLNAVERRLTRDRNRDPTTKDLALALDWWRNANIGCETLPSADVKEYAKVLANAESEYIRENGDYPTAAQMAERLEWEAEDVKEIRRLTANAITQVETLMRQRAISLGAPVGEEESTLEDFIKNSTPDASEWASPDAVAMKALMREDGVDALDALPPRLRFVLALRFGFIDDRPRALEEVARALRVTRERVRQLEKQAIRLLKASNKLPRIEELERE